MSPVACFEISCGFFPADFRHPQKSRQLLDPTQLLLRGELVW